MPFKEELRRQFGTIDIYLFDQLLKGRFDDCTSVLEVGCGTGRNLVFFLRSGIDVYGIDRDPDAIAGARKRALELAPGISPGNFREAEADKIPFAKGRFDAVIGNAVLHFAADESHFHRMLGAMWQVLKPGGLLFTRLASSIGLEAHIRHIEGRRCLLPDGNKRFLVDEAMLLETTKRLGADLLDPLKTTNVNNIRCMTTWCVRKKK